MWGKGKTVGLMLVLIGLSGYLCACLVAVSLFRAGGVVALCGLKGLQRVIGNAVTVVFACLIVLILCLSSYAIWEGMTMIPGLPELELEARTHPGTADHQSHSSRRVLNERRTPGAKTLTRSVDNQGSCQP